MTPTFLVLGTAKAGTTTLHHCFDENINICMSDPKETWFFDGSYQKGVEFYRDTYFTHRNGEKIIGEVATSYLYVPYVAPRIKTCFPNIKLIVILRNPIDRAYSDWWMMYTSGIEKLNFENAIANNLKRLEGGQLPGSEEAVWIEHLSGIEKIGELKIRTYLDYGYYYEQLSRYFKIFPQEQIKVCFFDQLLTRESVLIKELFEFIGIDEEIVESLPPRNTASPGRLTYKVIRSIKSLKMDRLLSDRVKEKAKAILLIILRNRP